jgi:hypothetical protein
MGSLERRRGVARRAGDGGDAMPLVQDNLSRQAR